MVEVRVTGRRLNGGMKRTGQDGANLGSYYAPKEVLVIFSFLDPITAFSNHGRNCV